MLSIPDQVYLAYERTFHPEHSPALLAEHVGVSRATVCNVVDRVADALQPHKRGPKPADCTAALEAENRFLYAYMAALEAELRESVRVTEPRMEDFVLTAAALGVSLRRIGELHQVAFDRVLSKDAAKGILDRYQPVARHVFQGLQPALHQQVTALAADEIFMGREPVLVGVAWESMAWVLVQRAEHRDGATWQAQLAPFARLEELVSDRGKGLLCLLTLRLVSAQGCPVAVWADHIDALLTRVWRASSLIEAMHSLLRGYQNNTKHVSEEFLYVCTVYYNLRPFRHGKRKGRSPFEILGIEVPCQNWLHLLRHPELVKHIATSKR